MVLYIFKKKRKKKEKIGRQIDQTSHVFLKDGIQVFQVSGDKLF